MMLLMWRSFEILLEIVNFGGLWKLKFFTTIFVGE